MSAGNQRVSLPAQLTVLGPLALAVAAMLAARVGAPEGVSWDIAWTSAATGALAGTLLARRRAPGPNRDRWNLWALAAGCWLFGQLAWDVYGVIGTPPSPNLADAGWWGFAVVVMLSMVRIPGGATWLRALVTIEAVPLIIAATLLQTRVINTPIGIRLGIIGGLVFGGAALILRSGFLGRRLRGMLNREREALAGVAEREAELARLNRQLAHLNRQLI